MYPWLLEKFKTYSFTILIKSGKWLNIMETAPFLTFAEDNVDIWSK